PLYGFRAPSIEVPVLRRSTGTGGAGPRRVLFRSVRGGPAGLSGAGLPRLGVPVGELDRGGLLPLGEQVEHLDQEREAHGGVDVALGHVEAEAVGDQGGADQQQERQGEHLDGGVGLHEPGQRAGGDQHHHHGDHHRRDHHPDAAGLVADHADRGDHRVEREDQVERDDLDQHGAEGGLDLGAGVTLLAFQALVDLEGGLPDQEEAADQQDQRLPGEVVPEQGEQRRGQLHDQGDRGEQRQPADQREPDAQPARLVPLVGGELPGAYRDEDQVVDPEDDLQHGQGEEADDEVGCHWGDSSGHGLRARG